ncbi:ABC transporter permease [Shinella sp.]|uniref:ABC transporter permease n=1 Tax=Shinella sp. TaxID=1870904 RepID=UPI00258788D5|nr:ABC transporter permease [Shinella sp.]MCW5710662.1 ABC transporter permease [Shinella sp.]
MTSTTLRQHFFRYCFGLALAIVTAALLVMQQGESVTHFFNTIIGASFDNTTTLLDLARWTSPLLLSGMAFLVAARAGIFNTGVEGQVVVGACAAAIAGSTLPMTGLPLMLGTTIAGCLGGLVWAFVPAVLYRRYRVNEVVITLMMNYIAVLACNLVIRSYFLAESSEGNESITVSSRPIEAAAQIPAFSGASDAGWTLLPTAIIYLVLAVLILKSRWGYDLKAVGGSSRFAQYAGVQVRDVQFRAFLLSGALGGLVGAFEVQGVLHRYIDGALTDFGWNGILVGLIGLNHPVGAVVSATFLGVLQNGQLAVQQMTNISPYMIKLIAALLILCVAVDPLKAIIASMKRGRNDV